MKLWFFVISIIYILSPVDLLPEMFAGRVGFLDDLLVVGMLYWYLIYKPALVKARMNKPGGGSRRMDNEEPRKNTASAPGDPYTVLGIARDASPEEIKTAYRQLANKYHPDKVSHLGDEFTDIADRRFKEIQSAYDKLTPKGT
jgi:hypothetical protein